MHVGIEMLCFPIESDGGLQCGHYGGIPKLGRCQSHNALTWKTWMERAIHFTLLQENVPSFHSQVI